MPPRQGPLHPDVAHTAVTLRTPSQPLQRANSCKQLKASRNYEQVKELMSIGAFKKASAHLCLYPAELGILVCAPVDAPGALAAAVECDWDVLC